MATEKIDEIRKELNKVIEVGNENLKKLQERGNNMETLLNKTEQLAILSVNFKTTAMQLKSSLQDSEENIPEMRPQQKECCSCFPSFWASSRKNNETTGLMKSQSTTPNNPKEMKKMYVHTRHIL